jgi:hypothetical protein
VRCFFDFGSWSISAEGPRRATLRIEEFEFVAPLIRSWLLGVMQRIFERSVSEEARVVDATPPMSPTSLFVVEVFAPK